MNMPGFTAETSVYKTSGHYTLAVGRVNAVNDSQIIPQNPPCKYNPSCNTHKPWICAEADDGSGYHWFCTGYNGEQYDMGCSCVPVCKTTIGCVRTHCCKNGAGQWGNCTTTSIPCPHHLPYQLGHDLPSMDILEG
jgi:hypothetical protein